jgi:phosphomannomutase
VDDTDLGELVGQAMTWRAGDPDPRTRRELDDLIELATGGDRPTRTTARAELADRFAGSLQFGTAGLRGELGAGSNRMNRAVVIRAAAGLAAYLRDTVAETNGGPPSPLVVVGFDARTDSDVFAQDTCAVLLAAGCTPLLMPGQLPTPVLAFAIRQLGADAGVMVTASHNPPRDNGYKVYLGGRIDPGPGRGAQIVPPADEHIAARIEAAPAAIDVPMARDGWQTLPPSIVDDYLTAVTGLVRAGGPRDLRVVLTPLHGVGGRTCVRAFVEAGFAAPVVVAEQADPDPQFPTVAFPNPEEPGAMDLALAAARANGADLVIANDPDADRCAVAIPDGAAPGGWRALRGDEVGALLGEAVLSRLERTAGHDGSAAERPVVASSIVSSQQLRRIAEHRGARHVETLTGFKWLSRVPGVVYAYEEALGYCVAPDLVRDKDGISAALLVAELAAELKARGRSLADALDDLALRHGLHATDQFSVRLADPALAAELVERLRATPPESLGGDKVVVADDLAAGVDGLPPTEGMRYRTANGARVIVRPSGTEPKLKCYLEVVIPTDGGLARARAEATHRLAALTKDVATLLDHHP